MRWFAVRVVPVLDEAGAVQEWMGTNTDITERKHAEQQVRESELRYRSLSRLVSTFAYSFDVPAEGLPTMAWITGSVEEVLGAPASYLEGKPWGTAVSEENSAHSSSMLKTALAGKSDVKDMRILTKDGQARWVRFVLQPEVDSETGRVVRIYGAGQDVTVQKEAEEALAHSEAHFRSLVQNSYETIAQVRADGTILYISPSINRLSGWSTEERVGQSNLALIHPEDQERMQQAMAAVLAGEELAIVEYRYLSAQQQWRRMESHLTKMTGGPDDDSLVINSRDITERKQAEEALARSEARFRSLVQNSSEVVTLLGPDGTIVYVSNSSERLTGHRPEDRVGRNGADLTHPDDLPRVAEALMAVIGGQSSAQVEYRYRNAWGAWMWVESQVTNMLGDPAVGALVLNTRDITERKQAEQALTQSEARFRGLVHNSSEVIALVGSDGAILYQSPSIERVMGYKPEERIGRTFPDLLHPEDLPRMREVLGALISGEAEAQVQYRYRHADGEWRWGESHATNMLADPNVGAIVVNTRDITATREAQLALKESMRRYRVLSHLVQTFAYVYEVPEDGSRPALSWITGSVEEVLGRPVSDFEGKEWGAHVVDEDQSLSEERLRDALSGRSRVDDMRMIDGAGNPRWVRFVAQPEVDAATGRVVHIYGAGQDVTAQKAVEVELRAAKEQAEEMTRLKDAFLANMSHEIRTPLTSILGFSELLRDVVDEDALEYVDLIESGGRRLKDTLTSVLELSQLQAGRIELHPTRLDVAVLLRETVDLLRAQASKKGVTITATSADAAVVGELDRTALGRILTNLAGNAVKFTNKGGDVTLSARAEGDLITLTVADTGIGISEAFLPHLFEEFRQESQGLARSHEGNGLGMTITKRMVDLMGGTIAVET